MLTQTPPAERQLLLSGGGATGNNGRQWLRPRGEDGADLDLLSAVHSSVSTHDVMLGGHADLDTATDAGSTIVGSCFQTHFSRHAEDPKSPATLTELSHFQNNLFSDQLGSVTREIQKLKHEISSIRSEAETQSSAREKGDAEAMRSTVELKQAVACQMEAVEREVKTLKRSHAEDLGDLKAILQQSQITVEKELRRLCSAADGSAQHLEMLKGTMEKEVSDRLAADEATSGRVDQQVQALKTTLQEQAASQERMLLEMREQMQAQAETMERQRDDLVKAIAAAKCDLQQEAEQQTSTTAFIIKELRQAMSKESSDRAEEAAQLAHRAAESLQQERDERCSSADALRAQITSLAASAEASRAEDRQSTSESIDTLRDWIHQEARELRDVQQKAASRLEEGLQMRCKNLDQTVGLLQHHMDEHQAKVEANRKEFAEQLRELEANMTAAQASVNNRLIEEQAVREQNMNAFKSSLEALDMRLQGQFAQQANEQTTFQAELKDAMGENKRQLDAQMAYMKELQSHDKMSREKEHNALRDNLQVQLREECLRIKEDVQSGNAMARELVNKVAADCQAGHKAVRDSLTEQKASMDSQQALLQGSLAEERATREQASRNAQAAVNSLDSKLTEELMKANAAQDAGIEELRELIGRQGQAIELHSSTTNARLAEECTAREEAFGNVYVALDSQNQKLSDKVCEVDGAASRNGAELRALIEAQHAGVQDLLVQERHHREQSEAAFKAAQEERVRNEVASVEKMCKESHGTLRELIGKASSDQQVVVKVLQDAFTDYKQGTDDSLEVLRAKLGEECSVREARERELHNSFADLKEQLHKEAAGTVQESRLATASLQELITKLTAEVEAQFLALNNQAAQEKQTAERSLAACQNSLLEDMGRLNDGHKKILDECTALMGQHSEKEASQRDVAIVALETKLNERLRDEMERRNQATEGNFTGIHAMVSQQVHELRSVITKEREDRELARCSLQVAFEELDTRVREDLDRLSADGCGTQDLVRSTVASMNSEVASLQSRLQETEELVEEQRSAMQAINGVIADRLKESQSTLWDQVEKERALAREAGMGGIKEFRSQIDQKLHGVQMEMRNAFQALEHKTHSVRLEDRDRFDTFELKVKEELDSLATDQRSGHSILQGQIMEVQSKVDAQQSLLAGQLQEEQLVRESGDSRLNEKLNQMEQRFAVGFEQECSDREATAAQIRQQVQHQEQMQREELRCELKSEMTKIWDAVNNHTHDMNAVTIHKVHTNKQSQQSHNNVNTMKGARGMGFRSVSPGPSHSPSAAAFAAVADVHRGQAMPQAPQQSSRALAIEGPVQRSPSGPLFTVKQMQQPALISGGRSVSAARTPRPTASPTTIHTPAPCVYATSAPSAQTRTSSAPRTQSVSVLPPPTSGSSYVAAAGSPVEVWKTPAPPQHASGASLAAAAAMHESSGMVFSAETVDTSEEIRKLACGPTVYGPGHYSASASSGARG